MLETRQGFIQNLYLGATGWELNTTWEGEIIQNMLQTKCAGMGWWYVGNPHGLHPLYEALECFLKGSNDQGLFCVSKCLDSG